ncbi:MAG: hypothetical protein M3Y50_16770 [Acidobacteriota bacterium]|nr:hypothetical protein [Acidobacteriota bacterium]
MRRVGWFAAAVAVLLGLAYAGDWMVLRGRMARGTAFGVVEVNRFLATSLKGNKVEYDAMGRAPVRCSRSVFPQQGSSACWWVERHKTEWQ